MIDARVRRSPRIDEEVPNIGRRARAIRKAKSMTLKQVSERSGVSIATLSKIENEQSVGSFNTLYKVARGLGVMVEILISPDEERPIRSGRRIVNKLGSADEHTTDYYDYFVHGHALNSKKMVPLVMRIKTDEVPPLEDWSTHEGEEFVFVIEGEIEFHCEEYAPIFLSSGESVYFDSLMRHAFVKKSDDDAVLVSVSSAAPA
ncbi:MAG: helix-turn-helix domain-containing protein [Kiloniellaceae bacterium]